MLSAETLGQSSSNIIDASINDSPKKLVYRKIQSNLGNPIKKQQKLRTDLNWYIGLADNKIESFSSIVNLFILLLVLTLGGKTYNHTTAGAVALGWICVGQIVFAYFLVAIVKVCVIPRKEKELRSLSAEGFILYKPLYAGKKQLQNYTYYQLKTILKTTKERPLEFQQAFPQSDLQTLQQQLTKILKLPSSDAYQQRPQIQSILNKENNAQWWQTFLQVFIVGKTYTVPGVILLGLIITPLTVATVAGTSVATNIAQGWIAVGVWAGFILVDIVIRCFLWDKLNYNVEFNKSQAFLNYNLVYLKQKDIKNYSLAELESLEKILLTRGEDFDTCFKPNPGVKSLLADIQQMIYTKLPRKDERVDQQIRHVVYQEYKSRELYNNWLNFSNLRTVVTIINVLKFFIVVAITFVEQYPNNAADMLASQRAIGSLGIIFWVFGYVFYAILKCVILDKLEKSIQDHRASPYLTYRLVYFGNKTLQDLQFYELEDIVKYIDEHRQKFATVFPNIKTHDLQRQAAHIIKERKAKYPKYQPAFTNLSQQNRARKVLAALTAFYNAPLLQSIYSTYVLLVLLIVSIAHPSPTAIYILGYFGVAVVSTLIVIVMIFKFYVLPHYESEVKRLHIDGWSEYNHVYAKEKELDRVSIPELRNIDRIITDNPLQFKKCFPKANVQAVHKEVTATMFEKASKSRIRTAEGQQRYQTALQDLNSYKNSEESWATLVKDKYFVITPIVIVVYILWVQTIAKTLYGLTVCGFLTVGELGVMLLILLIYNCGYHDYLCRKVEECEADVQSMENNFD